MQGLHGLILNRTFLNFLSFYLKKPCKKKKVRKNCFDEQEKVLLLQPSLISLILLIWKKFSVGIYKNLLNSRNDWLLNWPLNYFQMFTYILPGIMLFLFQHDIQLAISYIGLCPSSVCEKGIIWEHWLALKVPIWLKLSLFISYENR